MRERERAILEFGVEINTHEAHDRLLKTFKRERIGSSLCNDVVTLPFLSFLLFNCFDDNAIDPFLNLKLHVIAEIVVTVSSSLFFQQCQLIFHTLHF